MSKFSGLEQFKQGTFSYVLGKVGDEEKVATLDVNKVLENPEFVKAALHFAIKTAARNARASIKPDEVAKAYEAVTSRFKAWGEGVWRAASEATGEPRTSLLARAVAEVMGIEPDEAAEQISQMIEAAVDAAGLSADEEGDKAKIRKIGADIRTQLRSTKDVAKVYARLQAEEAVKRSEAAQQAESDAPALKDLLKKPAE